MPLVVIGAYLADFPFRQLGILTLIITVTSMGFVLAWSRLATGSICVASHGSWRNLTSDGGVMADPPIW